MEEIKFTLNGSADVDELKEVFKHSGLDQSIDNELSLRKMLIHAKLIVTARHQGKLVGIARAFTDFSYCCFLSEVAVRKEYQQHDIATRLIDMVRREVEDQCNIFILAVPGAESVYQAMGLDKADTIFMIPKKGTV